MGDSLVCGICGRKMQWLMDTLLCPVCNADVIFDLNVYVKKDVENIKKKSVKK